MIHGVGVDLVHLDRFERFARDHRAGVEDLFSAAERRRFPRVGALAAAWAVKEASLKALGGLSGWDVNWREIEVLAGGGVRLSGDVARHAARVGAGALRASTAQAGPGAVLATVFADARATRAQGVRKVRSRGQASTSYLPGTDSGAGPGSVPRKKGRRR